MDTTDHRSLKSVEEKPSDDAATTNCSATLVYLKEIDLFAKRVDESSLLSRALTGKYDCNVLLPIVERIWTEKELQTRIEKNLGITMLHIICYAFDHEKLYELLKKQKSVNARAHEDSSIWPGYTPLHALVSGFLKIERKQLPQKIVDRIIQIFIHRRADVTLVNANGDTPLLMAAKAQNTDAGSSLAILLFKLQRDFSLNPVNINGFSHFHVACFLNDVQAARMFLKHAHHVDVNEAVGKFNDRRFSGRTPLLLALATQVKNDDDAYAKVKVVDVLLQNGADVRLADALGYTPLHELAACTSTRQILLDRLLTYHDDINSEAIDGKTPMEILLRNGALSEEVEYFFDQGARLNSYNKISGVGYMAIVLQMDKSTKSPNTKRILQLMINSPDISIVSNTGRNAIHNLIAINNSNNDYHEGLCFRLIERLKGMRKCNISQQDIQGRTPLHTAVEFSNGAALSSLLALGADINITDREGKSPLSYAAEFGDDDSARSSQDLKKTVCKIIARHVRKLQIIGLQVSALNAGLLEKVLNARPKFDVKPRKIARFIRQLSRVSEDHLCDKFTIGDFLCDTGAVHTFASLHENDRKKIDNYFEYRVAEYYKMTEIKKYLELQYLHAMERPFLIMPAISGFRELLGFILPDLCAEAVFTYLTNLDLKNMILAANKY